MIPEFLITDGGNILKNSQHELRLGKPHPFTFSTRFLY